MLVKEAPGPGFIKLDQLSTRVKDQPAKALLSPISPLHVDGLVQERCNSIANALELHLSYTNPSMYKILQYMGGIRPPTWYKIFGTVGGQN